MPDVTVYVDASFQPSRSGWGAVYDSAEHTVARFGRLGPAGDVIEAEARAVRAALTFVPAEANVRVIVDSTEAARVLADGTDAGKYERVSRDVAELAAARRLSLTVEARHGVNAHAYQRDAHDLANVGRQVRESRAKGPPPVHLRAPAEHAQSPVARVWLGVVASAHHAYGAVVVAEASGRVRARLERQDRGHAGVQRAVQHARAWVGHEAVFLVSCAVAYRASDAWLGLLSSLAARGALLVRDDGRDLEERAARYARTLKQGVPSREKTLARA